MRTETKGAAFCAVLCTLGVATLFAHNPPQGVVSPGSSPSFGDVTATGQFLAADGTAGAPSYSFTSDPSDGISNASGALHFSTNGTSRFSMTNLFVLSSVKHYFENGIIFDGSEEAFLDSDGTVGGGILLLGKTLAASDGALRLAALGQRAETSDATPADFVITGHDSYGGGAVTGSNDDAADLILTGGIGQKLTTVIDYTQTLYTVVLVINGSTTTLTEGTEWTNATSDEVSAGLLAAYIEASVSNISATATGDIVYMTPDASVYSFDISETGTGNTVTEGADGQVFVPSNPTITVPSIAIGDVGVGIGVAGSEVNIISSSVRCLKVSTGSIVHNRRTDFVDVTNNFQDNAAVVFGTDLDAYLIGDGATAGLVRLGTTSGGTDGTLETGTIDLTSNFSVDDNKTIGLGTSGDSFLRWSTIQTNDSLQIVPGDTSNTITVVDVTHSAVDYAHANQSNPTIFLHANSATTTLWGSLAHDGTNFVIATGSGVLDFAPSGATTATMSSTTFALGDNKRISWGAGQDRFIQGELTALADDTANEFLAIQSADGDAGGCVIHYTAKLATAGGVQVSQTGTVTVATSNGTAAIASSIGDVSQQAAISGTTTFVFAVSSVDDGDIEVTCTTTTDLTPTAITLSWTANTSGDVTLAATP